MSIHLGLASQPDILRSTTAAQVHAAGMLSGTPQPIVVAHTRELRARVDEALKAGERHLAVDCDAWREPDVRLLSALVHCARRSREKGAVLDLLNLSGPVRASMQDLRLEERLGLA